MEIVRAWEEKGVKISAPFSRTIKCLFAPDKGDVREASFNFALIDPDSGTDCHKHDRPELIYVVSGRGYATCDGSRVDVQPDTILWVRAGEMHELRNTGAETLKLFTVFIPGMTVEQTYKRCIDGARQNAPRK